MKLTDAAMSQLLHLKAVADACRKLKTRDKREIEAFQEIVQEYELYLNRWIEIQALCDAQAKEIELLREHKDALAETLHDATTSAFKNEHVKAMEDKLSSLQVELTQSYRNNAELAQQVVQAMNGLQETKNDIEQKQLRIEDLEIELETAKAKAESLEEGIDQLRMAVEVSAEEASLLKGENQNLNARIRQLEDENRNLVDRWIKLKMEEAERLNEANAIFEDMMSKSKAFELVKLAERQVDGLVRASDDIVSINTGIRHIPTGASHMFNAHDGGCLALAHANQNGISLLCTGGNDKLVKSWDLNTATLKDTFKSSLGSILDIAVGHLCDFIIGCSSDRNMYLWGMDTLRVRHVLTGHTDKIVSVNLNAFCRNIAVSAAYDRTMKLWDLERGYNVKTLLCHSNCNSIVMNVDGKSMCSGHADGRIRIWDNQSGKVTNEIMAHGNSVTCVRLSDRSMRLLSCGKDNVINVFDVRNFEILGSFRAHGFSVPTNWSKVCFSDDERYVAAGSIDGSVFVWNNGSQCVESVLKEHSSPVVACAWGLNGLVSADKLGFVRLWS